MTKREERLWDSLTLGELIVKYGSDAIVYGDYDGYLIVEWEPMEED